MGLGCYASPQHFLWGGHKYGKGVDYGNQFGNRLATALELARAGHHVFATMRNPERSELAEIADHEHLPIEIRKLDVNSDESVGNCFANVAEPLPR